MTSLEILDKLKVLGSESTKKVLLKHGAREPIYGVKIEELKKIQKVVKKDYQLSKDLFNSGVSDAMYLAGLIADENKMTKKDLQEWAEKATWNMLTEYSVAWVAAESRFAIELASGWIDEQSEKLASTGWATWSNIVSLQPDSALDLDHLKSLLKRVEKNIHNQPNRVRYTMNQFIISVGSHVDPLTKLALETAAKIGKVTVNMGETNCKVPPAGEYIQKVIKRTGPGKKKKTVRC